jgi:hypothetical protein
VRVDLGSDHGARVGTYGNHGPAGNDRIGTDTYGRTDTCTRQDAGSDFDVHQLADVRIVRDVADWTVNRNPEDQLTMAQRIVSRQAMVGPVLQ